MKTIEPTPSIQELIQLQIIDLDETMKMAKPTHSIDCIIYVCNECNKLNVVKTGE